MASLRDECVSAFMEGNFERALHLLPLVEQPKLLQAGIYFGIYIIRWCPANLLHLSSWNGWFDVVKDLITITLIHKSQIVMVILVFIMLQKVYIMLMDHLIS